MITAYRTEPEGLKSFTGPVYASWINIEAPLPAELNDLSGRLGVPMSFLTDALDVDERARVEKEDNYVLIIIRVPYYNEKNSDIPFSTLPLGIIYNETHIITICNRKTGLLADFINQTIKGFSTENKVRFICQLFLKISLQYLNYLKQINALTAQIEDQLRHSMKNEELIRLLNCEKSLVFFTTSLKSNEIMIDRLMRTRLLPLDEEARERLDDIIVENRQAVEMANIYSNILSGMMDAFASVISNNLNVVMKFLTSITIILMLPTLVASVYGMNVKIPFQNSQHAFLITMVISFGVSALGVLFFWKRRWF